MTMRSDCVRRNVVDRGGGTLCVLAGAGAIAIAISIFAGAFAFGDETEKPSGANVPRPRLTLSREVTFFTEPLAADGLVDYAAALNARFGKGVTPENSVAVALLGILGPDTDLDGKEFGELCADLGIAPLPKDGDYFVPLNRFVDKLTDEFYRDRSGTAKRVGLGEEALRAQLEKRTDWSEALERCQRSTWIPADEPVISAWLDTLTKSLATFRHATTRPRYWIPYKSGSLFSGMLRSSSLSLRTMSIVDALGARAMRSLGAGDAAGAWKDVMTIRRWAGLVCDPKPIMDQIIGVAILQDASAAACLVAVEGKLTSAELKKLQAEWQSVTAMPDMSEAMAVGERCFALDLMNTLHRVALDPAWLRAFDGFAEPYPEEIVESPWRRRAIDAVLAWSAAYETMNIYYDELAAIGKLPSGKERKAAAVKLEERIERVAASQANPFQWFSIAVLDHRLRRKAIARYFIAARFVTSTMPTLAGVFDSEDRMRMQLRLVDTTFALARHRAVLGKFPSQLEELAPTLVEKVPVDALGEGALHYQRRADGGFELYSVGINGKDDEGRTQQPFVDTAWIAAEDASDADDLVVRIGLRR